MCKSVVFTETVTGFYNDSLSSSLSLHVINKTVLQNSTMHQVNCISYDGFWLLSTDLNNECVLISIFQALSTHTHTHPLHKPILIAIVIISRSSVSLNFKLVRSFERITNFKKKLKRFSQIAKQSGLQEA